MTFARRPRSPRLRARVCRSADGLRIAAPGIDLRPGDRHSPPRLRFPTRRRQSRPTSLLGIRSRGYGCAPPRVATRVDALTKVVGPNHFVADQAQPLTQAIAWSGAQTTLGARRRQRACLPRGVVAPGSSSSLAARSSGRSSESSCSSGENLLLLRRVISRGRRRAVVDPLDDRLPPPRSGLSPPPRRISATAQH